MAVEWFARVLARFAWSARTVGRGRRRVTLRKWVPWPNLDRLLTARLRFEHLEDRVTPATVTWDGGAGTFNWENAQNWDTNALPTAADDVVIPDLPTPGTTFVDLNSAQSVNSVIVIGTDVYTNQGANLSLTPGASLTVTNGVSVTHGGFRVFDATVTAATVTLNTAGFLDGAKATVTADVANVSGGLSWGDGGYGLTGFPLTIAGTYTQGAAGNFYVASDAVANSVGGVVSVTGTASLDGFIVLNPLDNDPLDVTQGFTILQAGAVTGGFAFPSWYGNNYGTWSLDTPFKTGQTATDVTLTGNVRVVSNAADSGAGSLRQAILDANASGQPSLIGFRNVGTIAPASELPSLTVPAEINATQLAGYAGTPLVELRGDAAGAGKSGLQLSGAGSIVRGLAINRFNGFAVRVLSDSAVIAGNRIGTNPAGDTAVGGGGIQVFAGIGTVVGGPNPTDRNLISTGAGVGNGVSVESVTSNTTVRGNYIGTDAAGTAALGNVVGVFVAGPNAVVRDNVIAAGSSHGLSISGFDATGAVVLGNWIGLGADGSTALGNGGSGLAVSGGVGGAVIGDGTAGGRNVISANSGDGITFSGGAASNNLVRGNYIGTDATGLLARGNTGAGVRVVGGGDDNQIGGFTAVPGTGAGNVIAGNGGHGVAIEVAGTDGTRVWGNLIGLGADGSTALGNAKSGVYLAGAKNTQIGGDDAADGAADGAVQARNVISGNVWHGIEVVGDGASWAMNNTIAGNSIGTDRAGAAGKGNALSGVGFVDRASDNVIGGTTAGAGNVISGNTGNGVWLNGISVTSNRLLGNIIGLNADQSGVLPNSDGVAITAGANGNFVGTGAADAGNVISGNVYGVLIQDAGSSNNRVQGNRIGTNRAGDTAFGNQVGVFLYSNATGNYVGTDGDLTADATEGNLISANATGVYLQDAASNNTIAGNRIGTDATGTAVLGTQVTGVWVYNDTVDGTFIGTNADGNSDDLEGNLISGNTSVGVRIDAGDGTTIAGNVIGLNAAGTAAIANGGGGIGLTGGSALTTIGGTAPFTRNVISGNAAYGIALDGGNGTNTGTNIQGNYIGLAADGTTPVGNTGPGILLQNGGATTTTIGGTTAVARNVIGGNTGAGVAITGSGNTGNTVLGNYIGTDSTGMATVANAIGVDISGGATGNTVGGAVAGAGNVISGNTNQGVQITGDSNKVQGNIIGLNAAGTAKLANDGGVDVGAFSVLIGTDGDGVGDGFERNVISGNTDYGILMIGGGNNRIAGNYIGTKADGTGGAVGNGFDGIFLQSISGVVVGTDGSNDAFNANEKNIISGNGDRGVVLEGANVVAGNWIGLDITGASAGTQQFGVQVTGTGSVVGTNADGIADAAERNVISGNTNTGITMSSTSATVAGNYIGTDSTGLLARPNGVTGINIGSGGTANTIGGATAVARNVISGNAQYGVVVIGSGTDGNTIQGNYIGVDQTGQTAVGNALDGILVVNAAANTLIGGTAAGAGNVISGNARNGIQVNNISSGTIQGNVIGLAADGVADRGNASAGIVFSAGANAVLIGGTAAGAGNVISGNDTSGIDLVGGGVDAVIQGNFIGTDLTGTLDRGNTLHGVNVQFGTNVTIGAATATPGTAGGNVISGNNGDGIRVAYAATSTTTHTIQGNLIGLTADGAAALGNSGKGVYLLNAAFNTVGGATAASRNVISGNTGDGVYLQNANDTTIQFNRIGTDLAGLAAVGNGNVAGIVLTNTTRDALVRDNLVSGNITGVYIASGAAFNELYGNSIGTDATGATALPNTATGVRITTSASLNTVGGTTAADRNVISGNLGHGVLIDTSNINGNVVQGNYIGTDVNGGVAVPNGSVGVILDGGTRNNTVGGTTSGARNVISGNYVGVQVNGAATAGNAVTGNYIGTDAAGAAAVPNAAYGVYVTGNATGTVIGGLTAVPGTGAGNVISGNNNQGINLEVGSDATVIRGNVIGLTAAGTAKLGNAQNGINVNSSGNTIGGSAAGAGNVISGNAQAGVTLFAAANNTIAGNRIGTDLTGAVALGNTTQGVFVRNGSTGNTIGGSAAGAGNVISGNVGDGVQITGSGTTGTVVQGNFIGTAADGLSALGNGSSGMYVFGGAAGTTVGGTTAAARNVLSGNTANGVAVSDAGTDGTIIQGNFIGTDKNGTAALPNLLPGVAVVNGATNTQIGGLTAAPGTGAGNVISGNKQHGVMVRDVGTTGTVVQGNLVGLAAGGTSKLGNGTTGAYGGVVVFNGAATTTIGGTDPQARNVISGNENMGVALLGAAGQVVTGTVVQGNFIGTDITGATAIGNGLPGVGVLDLVANTTVGGTAAGAGNVISGNAGGGVVVSNYFGGGAPTATTVQGNRIGTDLAGTAALPNTVFSARLDGSGVILEKVANTTVGGTAAGAGNVISGNAGDGVRLTGAGTTGNTIAGNFIGTNAAGTADLGNSDSGVYLAPGADGNTIGGTTAAARNVISGNDQAGVLIESASNLVQGNYIGLNAAGTAAVGNGDSGAGSGIALLNAAGNMIGGTTPAARNVISGNQASGLAILFAGSTGNVVAGNYVGTDAAGTTSVPNEDGIAIFQGTGNTIGGTVAGAGNLVSGNAAQGVYLTDAGTTGNAVVGNRIGTNAAGTAALPNATGVQIDAGAHDNAIGTAEYGRTALSDGGQLGFPTGVAIAANGDIYVGVAGNALVGLAGGIYRIDRITGAQTLVATGGFLSSVANPPYSTINDLAFDTNGDLVVSNYERGVVRVNVTTAAQTLVSDFANPAEGVAPLYGQSVAIAASGDYFLTDADGNRVLRIAPTTGARTVVSSDGALSGAYGIAVEADGHLVVASAGNGQLLRIDPTTGSQAVLASGIVNPFYVTVAADRSIILTTADDYGVIAATLVRVDPDTGTTAVLATGVANAGRTFEGVAVESSGSVIVADIDVNGSTLGTIYRFIPGAARNVISGNAGAGVLIDGATTTGNSIIRNDLYGNAGNANLQLANGANGNTPAAVISGVLAGPVDSQLLGHVTQAAPNATYKLEVFYTPNDAPETRQFRTEVEFTTDAAGAALIDLPLGVVFAQGGYVTTTLTRVGTGDTGPISAAAPLGLVIIDGQPAAGVEGTPITLTTRAIDPGPGQRVGYAWRVTKNGADFAAGNEAVFTYTPDDNGAYVVSLTVTTTAGLRQDVTLPPLAVSNLNPVAELVAAPTADVPTGSSFTVQARLRDQGTADLGSLLYTWAVNGAPVAGPFPLTLTPALSYTPAAAGPYTVTLAVTDKDGGTNTLRYTVTAAGALPAAVIAVLSQGQEGTTVHARADLTAVRNQDDLTFAWQAVKNGVLYAAVTGKARPNFEFIPDDNGTYVVTLRVTGPGTDVTAPPRAVTVANIAPQPAIGYAGPAPTSFPAGVPISYRASVTDPGTADTQTYLWQVTDALTGQSVATASGQSFPFTPSAAGTYLVRLTATDDDAGAGVTMTELVVTAAPRAVAITGPTTGTEGDPLTFGSSITPPAGGVGFKYFWEARRNDQLVASASSPAFTTTPLGFTFIPPDNGTYVVSLRVVGADQSGATTSQAVTVANVPPTVTLTPSAGPYREGSPVTFTATAADPAGTNDPISYRWLVNGVVQPNQAGPTFTFTPPDNGPFQVQVQTKDDDMPAFGAAPPSAASVTLSVQNVAPSVAVGPATDADGALLPGVPAGFAYNLTAGATDPANPPGGPVNDPLGYSWAVTVYPAGGGAGAPLNPAFYAASPDGRFFSFNTNTAQPGTYAVTVTVTDGDGGSTPQTTSFKFGTANADVITVTAADLVGGATRVAVFALGGNDTVSAAGVNVPVVLDGGAGNDTLTGGSADDLILGGAGTDCLVGGAGNDTVVTQHGNDSVYTGTGDDSIVGNLGSDLFLSEAGGGGQDTIDLSGTASPLALDLRLNDGVMRTADAAGNRLGFVGQFEAVKGSQLGDRVTMAGGMALFGGAGADDVTVPTGVSAVTVFGGDGNDLAHVAGGTNVTVFGGAGNDAIDLTAGSNITVFGGDGVDTVAAAGATQATVFGGAGADDLAVTAGSQITVFGGSDDDILRVLGGSNVTVFGGDGDLPAGTTDAALVTQFGGSGNDQITVDGNPSLVTVFGGDGNDIVDLKTGSLVTVFGDAGDDKITLEATVGSLVTVFGGDGVDAVSVLGGTQVTVFGDAGDDAVAVTGGSLITVFGGDGVDRLDVLGGSQVTVFGGLEADALRVGGTATLVTVFGGDGNDLVTVSAATGNVTVFGDAGADKIDVTVGSNVTVFGGADDDFVTLRPAVGADVTVFGGDGNDLVDVRGGTRVTVFGGAGTDAVTVGPAAGTDITVFGGDGVDAVDVLGGTRVTVFGGAEADAVTVGAGSQVTVFGDAGDDAVTIGAAAGSAVTVFGGDGRDKIDVQGGTDVTVFGDAGNDTVSVAAGTNVTVFGLADDDALSVSGGTAVTVFGGDGVDAIDVTGGSQVTVFGEAGNDVLTVGTGSQITVFGGADDDTIHVQGGTAVTVFGGDGKDAIDVLGGTQVTVFGGTQADTVTVGAGTDVTVFGGDGDDAVQVLGGTNVTVFGNDGADVIGVTGGTNVTVFGGANDDQLTVSTPAGSNVTVYGGDGDDTVSVLTGSQVTVFGGAGSDQITVGAGAGTDITVFGGDGVDRLDVEGGTRVTVFGGADDDRITIGSAAGTDITVFGGDGNDIVDVRGGTLVTVFGEAGNDVVTSEAVTGSNVTVFGGAGNDVVDVTAGSQVTVFGESGNDTLSVSTAGTTVTVFGGSGNDVLTATGGTDVTLLGDRGNDSVSVVNVSNVTVFGGDGDDSLTATGGLDDDLYGDDGNDLYRAVASALGATRVRFKEILNLGKDNDPAQKTTDGDLGGLAQTDRPASGTDAIDLSAFYAVYFDLNRLGSDADPQAGWQTVATQGGQLATVVLQGVFENVIGTPGNDTVLGNAADNWLVGNGGDDSLAGAAGNDTLDGGAGNDTLDGGAGNDTYRFAGPGLAPGQLPGGDELPLPVGGLPLGTDVIVGEAPNSPADTADALDFSRLAGPVTADLGSTAVQTVPGVVAFQLPNGTAIENAIGSAGADSLTGNSRDNVLEGGPGDDTLTGLAGADTYVFAGDNLGADSLVEAASADADTLDFGQLKGGIDLDLNRAGVQSFAAAGTAVALSDPAAFENVLGSSFPDRIVGNAASNLIVGGGGRDYIDGRGGADTLRGGSGQVVYLDFTSSADPWDWVYTPVQQEAVRQAVAADFAPFGYAVTLTRPASGPYITIVLNDGSAGGSAEELDFRNTRLDGTGAVDAYGLKDQLARALAAANLPVPTDVAGWTPYIVGLTATVTAHEVGHFVGLRHGDAYGPLGSGVNSVAQAARYLPALPVPGSAGAAETVRHIMASPASVGASLTDSAGPTTVGVREAVKLAFNDTGTTVREAAAGYSEHGTLATAVPLGLLPGLSVPNTLPAGHSLAGQPFSVRAVAVVGSITRPAGGTSENDVYSFTVDDPTALYHFEVNSFNLARIKNPIDSVLRVFDAAGNPVPLYGPQTQTYQDDEFETPDAVVVDWTPPVAGTYYLTVDTYTPDGVTDFDTGEYELFVYSWKVGPDLGLGDIIVTDRSGEVPPDDAIPTRPRTIIPPATPPTIVAGTQVALTPAPTASYGEGSAFAATVGLTGAANANPVTYRLAAQDGFPLSAGVTLDALTGRLTVEMPNQTTARFRIVAEDVTGATAYRDVTIGVQNLNPTAAVTGPTIAAQGQGVTLTATAADPGPLDVLTYAWQVTGPGLSQTFGNVRQVTFAGFRPGLYTATLTVTDGDGGSTVVPYTVTVDNATPVPTIGTVSGPLTEGNPVTVNGSATDAGGLADVATLSWTVARGAVTVATGSGPSVAFTPADDGNYLVTLTATDKDGLSASVSRTVQVTNLAPAVNPVASLTLTETQAAALAGSFSDVPADAPFAYLWRVTSPAGPVPTGSAPTYSFLPPDAGTYSVLFKVTDKDGASAEQLATVTVTEVAPTAAFAATPVVAVGGSVTVGFSAVADSPNDLAAGFTYDFDLNGDGVYEVLGAAGATSPPTRTASFAAAGAYTVRGRVTDKDGASRVYTATVVVVQPGAAVPAGGDLYVYGTAGNDTVSVTRSGAKTRVQLNGTTLGTYTVADKVWVYAGTGNDTVTVDSAVTLPTALYGEAGNDTLRGGSGADQLDGGAGNDSLAGNAGDDAVFAGAGNDTLDGGAGNDLLDAGAADDLSSNVNTVWAGAGDDTVLAGAGNDSITGDAGNDSIGAGDGANTVWAGAGNDTVDTGSGSDTISGDDGNDSLSAGAGNNTVWAGAGNDTVVSGAGNDSITGDAGDDSLSAGDGQNVVWGGAGNDTVTTGAGNDLVGGDDGNNALFAGDGNNTVWGGAGNDTITTGAGNDSIGAGNGDNLMTTGAGNDTVWGGSGADQIDGGLGFGDSLSGGGGNDTLTDPDGVVYASGDAGADRIDLTFAAGWTLNGSAAVPAWSITGGAGNDTMTVAVNNPALTLDVSGDDGTDTIEMRGTWNKVRVFGGSGSDTARIPAAAPATAFDLNGVEVLIRT